ncbi:spore maturation protein B [Orenia metallireducens]|jgi:spore maturation protein B|uniref:Spore maturation protein B n=1 Tax=Orenia metallireducens TaxID=1413210 RepID=A0A285GT28_9FIRM|nr:spore maturation protein [Orenia metallireducens]PRX29884.1 spore maturation protein B [Orenia metallireducens]SNY25481.1 spore maturation protein B [Orenia metallireducens]
MINLINYFSQWAIPLIILLILIAAFIKKVKVYEVFTDGAVEGIAVGVKILPYLLAMLMAIAIFRASGALDIVLNQLAKPLSILGIPKEVIPLALIRPLSGTGSLGIVTDLINQYGPDSFIGRLASTMQGSTETTFYVAAVYFGAIGIKNSRHAILAGLLADLAGFLAAVFICRLVFG